MRARHRVIGFDIDSAKIRRLRSGFSGIEDVSNEEIRDLLTQGLIATDDPQDLSSVDTFVICVPTPLSDSGGPDLNSVEAAAELISQRLGSTREPLVILESTTYPGTTHEVVRPILERSGLTAGSDFSLAFSPERIDPGNKTWCFENTPKVVGGLTAECATAAADFYSSLGVSTVVTRGLMEAEMSKLLENTYRHINIALVNELSKLCHELNIDIWDVIRAAETKPYGFEAFHPGPGVGGHCIPIDPNYLSHRVKTQLGRPFRFVELAQEINASMPSFVVQRAAEILNAQSKPLNGSRVLLAGVSYKRNVGDIRESPAIPIAELLRASGCKLSYADPLVDDFMIDGQRIRKVDPSVQEEVMWDLVIILQEHEALADFLARIPKESLLSTRGPS